MSLNGKTAIVTGSNSGIGLGVVEELAKAGADVVLNSFTDNSEDHELAQKIGAEHGDVVGLAEARAQRQQHTETEEPRIGQYESQIGHERPRRRHETMRPRTSVRRAVMRRFGGERDNGGGPSGDGRPSLYRPNGQPEWAVET